jgi:hypothetical protein
LVEEYGLTKRFFNSEQLKVVVVVIADFLIEAKRAGKPVMGAWIWQAAPIGEQGKLLHKGPPIMEYSWQFCGQPVVLCLASRETVSSTSSKPQ